MRASMVLAGCVAMVVAVAGCGSSSGQTGSTGTAPGGPVTGLMAATHPACAAQGQAVAQYLNSGQPTSMDPTYGQLRQHVLTLSGDARSLAVRQGADAVIAQCDAQADAEDSRSAAASASAASASAAASRSAAATPACRAAGGSVHDAAGEMLCETTYLGYDGQTHDVDIAVRLDGSLVTPADSGGGTANRTECATGYYPRVGNGVHGSTGRWDPKLALCLPR